MSQDETMTFTGAVERVTFYSDDTNYGVIKVRPDRKLPQYASREGLVTVVGVMPELGVGEDAEFTGVWVEDSRYGMQMRVERVQPITPTGREGIIRYLSSGIVKGIGERRAQLIVDHFGDDTLTILNRHPERLTEVPQIKPSLAEKLAEAWAENVASRQSMITLQGYGISSKMAARIYDTLGAEAIATVQENPYALADEVFGIGFRRADQIAQNMGVPLDSPHRLRAGLSYTLSQLANDGHTYAPHDVLLQSAADELRYSGDRQLLTDILNSMLFQGDLIEDGIVVKGEPVKAVYLPMYHRAEVGVRDRLRKMVKMPSVITEDAQDIEWDSYLARLSQRNSVELSAQQQGAVRAALTSKISILTGGPGTGKTTTLQMVIAALEDGKYDYALVSPTGRAAKRLSEATERPAFTIHRYFGFTPGEGFLHDDDEPLDIEMLIVDEASMVDLLLFYNVLRGLRPETHILLVGDVDQLPSVGAGNVLRDVIDSGIAHVTRLDYIFRQEANSHIITNAHRINAGQEPFMDNRSDDFFFFKEEDAASAADLLVDVVVNRIPNKFGYHPLDDVQVLAPMYRSSVGVDYLNRALQNALNPASIAKIEKKIGDRVFRMGDKVMQTRNNYEKEVFNGDIGRVRAIDLENSRIEIIMNSMIIEYDFIEAAEELIHAYCISIHRSQGSEYPVMVMTLMNQHYMMLQRNLLYTAITRARQLAVIVGDRRAVRTAVKNNKVEERYSGLLARLKTS